MKQVAPDSVEARKFVKDFCGYVVHLKAIDYIYRELFVASDARIVMARTAEQFFLHLNPVINKYLLLELAKITDPPENRGLRLENFTVPNLVATIDWPAGVRDRLTALNDSLATFRGYIVTLRNKLLAHHDKETFLSGGVLGGSPDGEYDKAINALEDICNVAHEACFGQIFGQIVVSMPGDVKDLKKSLRQGMAFDSLFHDSRGDELIKLVGYLDRSTQDESAPR